MLIEFHAQHVGDKNDKPLTGKFENKEKARETLIPSEYWKKVDKLQEDCWVLSEYNEKKTIILGVYAK